MDPRLSQLEPEFAVLRPIGEGSMAHVYLARESALQRLVAIKVLRAEVTADEQARRRFEREARSAARLAHPSVVAIHRVGALSDDTPYLVMEYATGRNLADEIEAKRTLANDAVRTILSQVGSALAAAHAQGIVHRDVKPENVLWDPEAGRAVLTDFGIAGILEGSGEAVTRLTMAGQVLGDPTHMSPEQLRGEPVTAATDVYSLGVLGFELLTGAGPFEGANRIEMVTAHLRAEPRRLQDARPDAAPDLADVLARCLAKKPEHRPRASDVARMLGPDGAKVAAGGAASGDGIPGLRSFMAELRRRRVYNVAAVYLGLGFVLLEGSSMVLPALPLPEWVFSMIVALLLSGFPVALVLGWMYDITERGIRKSEAAEFEGSARTKLLVFQGVGLAVSLAAAVVIGWWILAN